MKPLVKELLPLVDADIIAHESCYAGQLTDEEGDLVILPFYRVADKIDEKLLEIMATLNTSQEPIMFLSGSTNFRNDVAKRKGYKANRTGEKPFHFLNAKAYITARYSTYTSVGCEADDLLCIYQTDELKRLNFSKERATTVICTRDKDLRQCRGWHYGWECGKQPEYKLRWVDELGELSAIYTESISKKTGKPTKTFKKLEGNGNLWFYAQLLTGDPTDNIPGVKGTGGVKAYKLLHNLVKPFDMFKVCRDLYKEVYGMRWQVELVEQAELVWMIRERNKNGSLKHWEIPHG